MRTLTKTGIRVLTKRYLSVLKKCAILNAMVLMLGTSSAMADVPEVNTWSGLKDAVGNTEVTTINVTGDITYDGTVGTISTISRTLSIIGYDTEIGDTANRILDGKFSNDSQTKGLVVNGGLTLENITMQNFNGGEVIGGAIENRGTISSITGDFEGNTTNKTGGAISNNGTIESITGDFKYNSATTNGGAVSNSQGKEINFVAENNKNITFDGNYVRIEKTTNKGFGGAIYNSQGTVGLYAKTINDTITFVGGENVIDTERPENSKYDIDGIFNIGTLNINGYVKDSITTKYLGTVNLYNVSDYSTLFGTTNIYGGTVNVKDTFTQMTLMLKGGTLNLGRNANVGNLYITDGAKLSLSIPDGTFENYENEINTLTAGFYSGVLSDLTVDYDATADVGSNMDKITINGAGSGSVAPDSSIKLVRVNVIKDGDTLNNGIFLTGTPAGTLDNIADNTETTSTTTSGGFKYIFTPSAKGVVSVTRTATEETLAQTIQNPTGSSSFSINTTPYTTNENLGSLAGDGRQFTIFGNDNIIEGNSYSGVTVSNGQTFNIVNATMQNFKIEGSGGAIINEGTITSITGDFTQNASSQGGAIFNYSSASYIPKIGDIKGNFVGNHADSTANFVSAGAIYNQNASIKSIAGDFINNYAKGAVGAEGGAIMNKNAETPIEFIKGNFAGNYAESTENYSVNGGAIYNVGSSSVINKLIGNFTNNAAITTGETANAKGGAIYNTGEIIEISESTFTGNMAKTSGNGDTQGGAIYNSGTITIHAKDGKDIKFEGNYVTSSSGMGGAIYNEGVNAIIGLYADTNRKITFVGGADETGKYDIDGIYNAGRLRINGTSSENTYSGTVILNKISGYDSGTTNIYGGNVVVKDTIEQIAVTVQGTLSLGKGGKVGYLTLNSDSALNLTISDSLVSGYKNTIDTLTVARNLYLNDNLLTVDYDATAAEGSNIDKIVATNGNGAIKLAGVNVIKDGDTMNDGTFLTGTSLDYVNDVTETTSTTTSGGFKYIFTPSAKGVVSVTREVGKTLAGEIQDPNGSDTFSVNTNPYMMGEDLGSLAGENRNFTIAGNGNTIDGTNPTGGKFDGITVGEAAEQVLNVENATMQNFTTAITNEVGSTTNINGVTFANNDTDIANDGTLKLSGTNSISTITGIGTTNIESGVVNATKDITQDNINVKSGATLASNTAGVEIKADGTDGNLINDGTINITGANSRFGADHLTNNATINITGANSLLETSTLTNNGTIDTVSLLSNSLNNNGNITTSGGIEAIIQNNEGGSITFNGDNKKQMRLTNSGTANFNGGLSETGSIIQLTQNAGVMNFSTNAIESTANLPINIFEMNGGLVNIADGNVNTLHIKKLNLAGNTNFAMDADLAAESMDKIKVNNATITDGKVININKINLLSATTEDKVSLDLFADDATKNALINNVHANINGLQYSPTYIYDAKYSTADGKITFTRTEQTNPYLYAPSSIAQTTAGMTGQIAGLAMDKLDVAVTDSEKGLAAGDMPKANNAWVKVMGFDDDVDFKHFNSIDSKAYTLAGGFNTDKVQFADVDAAFGIYGGYIGGKQKYTGNKIDQKGGYIGLSSELTKDNAFLLSTVNAGFINNEAENMYGTDKFDTRWFGIGLKGGYNYALTDTWTLQPNVYAGYTLVNTEDYTSKSGVRINNDNLNFFEIDPGFKLTKQIDNGWFGYIQGKYAIVMDNGGETTANEIVLPNISAKNYFEYGFGMNKSLTDAWSLNGEINRRDGGRSGWNGAIEFKYNF